MTAVALFAKSPEPGLVKTRLIPDLGAETALGIYRYCLRHALDTCRQSALTYRVYLSKDSDDSLFERENYQLQQGPDLGVRMYHALTELLEHHGSAMVIGSDCLDLGPGHLHQAAAALKNSDLVLLPAQDGGYALIGCRRIDAALFQGVDWGNETVLQKTLANARDLGFSVQLLETVRDIDRLQDVQQYPALKALISSE